MENDIEDMTSYDWVFLLALIGVVAIGFFAYLYDNKSTEIIKPISPPPIVTKTIEAIIVPTLTPTVFPTKTKVPTAENSPTSTMEPTPTLISTIEPTPPTKTPTATATLIKAHYLGGVFHTIRPNDTLWDLAIEFYEDPFLWPIICEENRLRPCGLIHVENIIYIPEIEFEIENGYRK